MKKYNVNGVEFFDWKGKPYCTINQCGIEATYPFEKPKTEVPIQAVLMDLDGTTVISEEFWIYLIEKTIKKNLFARFLFIARRYAVRIGIFHNGTLGILPE